MKIFERCQSDSEQDESVTCEGDVTMAIAYALTDSELNIVLLTLYELLHHYSSSLYCTGLILNSEHMGQQ